MKIKHILEAKQASNRKGWFWAIEDDVKVSLKAGHNRDQTMEYFNWVKDNRKTLNHMYVAFKSDLADIQEQDVENEYPEHAENIIDAWIGQLDYREFAVYQQLRKILPSEELDYAVRVMIDAVVDEFRDSPPIYDRPPR